ncbi:MAG TPA: aminotransferase class III-fold pyridoxal phosphate-dependent enzyme, partial [Verrucomicrobiales bacterium]|nr:aminotransferase class III-fold pyridoxal phosphate-dependent enzyme [Verrucomicrobiales bacterium]
NGMPVDAVVGRADVFARMSFGDGSDTWSGHPMGCAAVLATLDEFEQTDVLEQGKRLSVAIEECLLKLTELPAIRAVRGEGTVWGMECEGAGGMTAEQVAQEIVRLCYLGDAEGRGVHLLGPLAGKVIRVAPPLTMPVAELREYFDVVHRIVAGIGRV